MNDLQDLLAVKELSDEEKQKQIKINKADSKIKSQDI